MGIFRRKKEASYVDLHNNAVIKYRRAARTFIWAGIVNFVGLIIGVVQHYTIEANADQPIPFYFCFGLNDFLFSWFESFNMPIALFWVFASLIALATTAGAVLLGVYAAMGKKKILIAMISAYGIDWLFLILKSTLFFARDGLFGLFINLGIHVIISFFIIVAVYQFYNVVNIEKRFKDIPTVAEVKARQEQEKKESEEKENEHQS